MESQTCALSNSVNAHVPQLRQQHGLSLVVANGENAAGGSGITVNTAAEIFAAGVDIITSGDHLWDQKEVMGLLDGERRFVRPLNYPAGTPGQGSTIFEAPGLPSVAVLNLQGRTFMAALEKGRFVWWPTGTGAAQKLEAHQAQILLAAGNPAVEAAPVWRKVS